MYAYHPTNIHRFGGKLACSIAREASVRVHVECAQRLANVVVVVGIWAVLLPRNAQQWQRAVERFVLSAFFVIVVCCRAANVHITSAPALFAHTHTRTNTLCVSSLSLSSRGKIKHISSAVSQLNVYIANVRLIFSCSFSDCSS